MPSRGSYGSAFRAANGSHPTSPGRIADTEAFDNQGKD